MTARLAAAAGALAVAASAGALLIFTWPVESGRGYLAVLVIAALACLLPGLRGWPAGIGWAVVLLGAAFVLRARLDRDAAGWTPAMAGLLLFLAELVMWSFELETPAARRPQALRRLGLLLAVAVAAAAAVAAVELGAAAVGALGGGYAMLAAGVAAAVACVLLLAVIARSAAGRAT